jgi:hypothetical protein
MKEPPRNNNLDDLDPDFRSCLEQWLKQARAQFPQFEFRVGETRRTTERQHWLYRQNSPTRWVTNCDGINTKSMHQYGIAADLVIIRKNGPGKADDQAEWDARVWRTVYAFVPPHDYGMELIPQELVHLQMAGSQARYRNGRLASGFVQDQRLKLT